jgi:DNA ligase-4
VYASDEAEDGRYFNKTLEEVDRLSLVRDRDGGANIADDDASDVDDGPVLASRPADEEEEEPEEDTFARPIRTQGQIQMEDEWGLSEPIRPASKGRKGRGHDDHEEGEEKEEAEEEDEENVGHPSEII